MRDAAVIVDARGLSNRLLDLELHMRLSHGDQVLVATAAHMLRHLDDIRRAAVELNEAWLSESDLEIERAEKRLIALVEGR